MPELFEKIISLSKRRGFIFQSSEIYGGLGATYDYGSLGCELKRNVKERWWQDVVYRHENIEGIDSAIIMHPDVWKASGHVDAFHDPMIDDRQSNARYRADELIEQHIERLRRKEKDAEADRVRERLAEALNADDMPGALYEVIMDEEIRAPDSGAFDWTEVRQFNLMFETHMGPVADEDNLLYLRPETAQGTYVNFRNVQETARQQIPFGIAQIGKAFRNEIVARQFIFRTREFEQMEMQYFVKPGSQMEHFEQWRQLRMDWHQACGVRTSRLRWHEHDKLAHYADAAYDIQYNFPFGWQEIEGIHSRTDFDLKRHEELSGKNLTYYDPYEQEKYLPYVVETAAGLDRTVLMLLCDAYREEEVEGEERTVLKFHPRIAPITAAVFPLVKKEGMPEIAHEIEDDLREYFNVFYDEKGSMGKRYRRMDEAGTPYGITVDGQTLEDDTVTVRDRDTMEQVRISRGNLAAHLIQRMGEWRPEE